jgi:hypothetical protein
MQAEGELRAWREKHQQGQQAKEAFEQQLQAVDRNLGSCFELCCQVAAAQQASGRSTWHCGLTELLEVCILAGHLAWSCVHACHAMPCHAGEQLSAVMINTSVLQHAVGVLPGMTALALSQVAIQPFTHCYCKCSACAGAASTAQLWHS